MQKIKNSILELAGLIYCFALSAVASTGNIAIKIARVLLFCAFIVHIFQHKKMKVNFSKYSKWIIIMFIYSCMTMLWSVSVSTTIEMISTLLYIVVCNLILMYILNNNKEYIYSMLKSSILGTILHGILLFSKYGLTVYFGSRGGHGIENANTIAFMASFALIFCFILLKENKIKSRVLYYVLAVFCLIIALLSASKKIFIYILVFFIVYYIFSSKNILKKAFKIIMALGVVYFIYILVMKNQFLYNLIGNRIETMFISLQGGKGDGSTTFRIHLIEWGIEWFKARPILGYGADCFKYLLGTNYNTWAGTEGIYAHNNYIELLVDFGLIGTLIYYYIYSNVVANFFKKSKCDRKKLYGLGIILSIFAAEIGQITYSIAYLQQIILIAFFLSNYNMLEKRNGEDNKNIKNN